MNILRQITSDKDLKAIAYLLAILASIAIINGFFLQAILSRRQIEKQDEQKEEDAKKKPYELEEIN